jgi:hypothetical protein
MNGTPPVIISPPLDGRRRVTIRGDDVGAAAGERDVREMLSRAGFAEDVPLDDPALIEWQGGGPDAWT